MDVRRTALGVALILAMRAQGAAKEDARAVLSGVRAPVALAVHVGCGDGGLVVALRAAGVRVVQGLERDAASVRGAREQIRAEGLDGTVSVDTWEGAALPYADNMVNLLVVERDGLVAPSEQLRVLAPGGIARVRRADGWADRVKPVPPETDEWTHYLHDASGNPVARDALVGPPRFLQWSAAPMHTRSHEYTPSIWALLSTGGRIFHVQDKAPAGSMAALPQWHLVARDAYNGLLLWERPLDSWYSHLVGWTSSPIQLQRRLVAVADRLYVPLARFAPVSMLDAGSGGTLRTFAETAGADEIVCHRGVLLVVACSVTEERLAEDRKLAEMARRRGSPLEDRDAASPFVRSHRKAENSAPRSLLALDPKTGDVLWRKEGAATAGFRQMSLQACGDRAYYHTKDGLHCVELRTGQLLWNRPSLPVRAMSEAGGICWSKEKVQFLSAEDGSVLWTQQPVLAEIRDVFLLDDAVWIGGFKPYSTGNAKHTGPVWGPYFAVQRDPKTGRVLREIAEENPGHHHRCYASKATERYILGGRRGTEFLDLESGDVLWHSWARGTCRYGVMPANGTLYVPPHSCACYLTARVTGFNAMVTARSEPPPASPRLAKGPAYGMATGGGSADSDWPTYRATPDRSGRGSAVPVSLRAKWTFAAGAELAPPTVADGKVFVASPEDHRLHALDRNSGASAWAFVAGGRIDSPPTIHGGQALFGCRDGHVYSLRAADGALAWRFRGRDESRRIASYGQLESVSPVHGSVLVQDGVLAFTAGRSSFLDGGIALCRLDPATGELLSETPVYSPDPETGRQPAHYNANKMPGARSDILVGDGEFLYLRDLAFTKEGVPAPQPRPHLFTLTDFLDGSWPHRSYWIFGTESSIASGCSGQIRSLTYGRLLLFDAENVYGYARGKVHWSNQFQDGPYRLFGRKRGEPKITWGVSSPVHIRAMVLAGDAIFAAGPVLEHPDEPDVSKGALLVAFSATDGRELSRIEIPASPVFDGMAAAGGSLFLVLEGGRVMCFSAG